MGDCMARNLIKGGRDVIVWNRTRSKAVDFSRQTGCQTAGSPREVRALSGINTNHHIELTTKVNSGRSIIYLRDVGIY